MVLHPVNAISGSTESQGEVTVRLQNSGRVVNGVGSDPDIVVASAKGVHQRFEQAVQQGRAGGGAGLKLGVGAGARALPASARVSRCCWSSTYQ